jgi:imidazolonepropionase-like amidohydrolase
MTPFENRRFVAALAGGLLLAVPLSAQDDAAEKVLVLRGATVHPVSGPPIPNGTVVVRGNKIEAVGAGLDIPAGAEQIDLAGKHLFPGFVHAGTQLGLVEIESVRGTEDTTDVGNFNPDHRAEIAFHADSLLLPATRAGGVVAAHVMMQGSLFVGTSAVMRLQGWNYEDMTIASPVGQHLYFPAPPPPGEGEGKEEAKKKRDEALKSVNDALADAHAYKAAKAAKMRGLDVNPKLEAMIPLLEGQQPLYIHADNKAQIEAALDWAKEKEFKKLVLVAGQDAQLLTERLKAENISVILTGALALPERKADPYDGAFTAAAKLNEAGVPFCMADRGTPMLSRNLPFNAGMAAAFGLPKEVALRSVTLSAAEILGVADRLGSLEAGKEASFFVSDGDPLEITTHIERVWINGQEVDLENDHQRRLWHRYESRPKPAAPAPAKR